MRSLTRSEAHSRAATLSVRGYDVALDLPTSAPTFSSRSTIRFDCAEPGASTFAEIRAARLDRATLNGSPLADDAFDVAAGRLTLAGLAAENELVVEAQLPYSHDGEGLHRHVDPADGQTYLYATSFLDSAPRWFACFDQPDLKAPFRLSVQCDPDWTVAGNGPAVGSGDGRWQLASAAPISTYLATVIAGPYHTVRAEHDGIPLALHARASLGEHLDRDADELLTHTRACLDEFHRLFGIRYPWGEYHQAFVPDFNAGAMENPGCVTFADQMVFRSRASAAEHDARANVVAHEMAHMWFGDLVTMRWWDDLWLNESFAEYLGHRVCDSVGLSASWVQFGVDRKAWGYSADRRPSTHPVAGNGATDTASALTDFDGISYAKGASVIRQLAARLGDEVFLDGLGRYFAAHAYANAEFADLIAAWTAAGAPDLPLWTRSWLQSAGLDTLRVDTDGATARLRREPPAGSSVQREHAISIAGFDDRGVPAEVISVLVRDATTEVAIASDLLVVPDLGDQTWAKIAFSPTAWRRLPTVLPRLQPSARVVVWNAARLAVADAELDPAQAVELGLSALGEEDDDSVLARTVRWLVDTCVQVYLAEPARGTRLRELADLLAALLRDCPDGSDRQLALARGLVSAQSDPAVLRPWLSGDGPPGLAIDAELRWLILTRLSALGALSADELAAEAAADRSAQGAIHAATCRALRPDPATKAAAWDTLMTRADAVNSELYALSRGFWHPTQTELTAPYVARYFAEIPATAGLRSGWVAGELAARAFPWTAVEPATVELTDQLLARDDLDPAIRRAAVDAGDDLRRAVRSRERFAASA